MNRFRVSLAPYQALIERFRAERGIKVKEIADAVRTMHRMFTRQTPFKPGYLADPHLRLGYTCYWTPLGAAKLASVLQEVSLYDPGFGTRNPIRMLDVGCGTGAGLLGAAGFWNELDYTGFDRVAGCFEDARLLLSLSGRKADARFVTSVDDGGYDLVALINSHREIGSEAFVERLLDKAVRPEGYVVIIEPGDREPTLALMRFRDSLAAKGIRVSAPCLPQTACPMLRENPDMWCSMEVPVDRPRFLAEVDERLGFDKTSLKFSYVVLTRSGRALADLAPEPAERLVGDLHRSKGRHWGTFCAKAGSLCERRLLSRDVTDDNRDFTRAARGDLFEFKGESISPVKGVDFPESRA